MFAVLRLCYMYHCRPELFLRRRSTRVNMKTQQQLWNVNHRS